MGESTASQEDEEQAVPADRAIHTVREVDEAGGSKVDSSSLGVCVCVCTYRKTKINFLGGKLLFKF